MHLVGFHYKNCGFVPTVLALRSVFHYSVLSILKFSNYIRQKELCFFFHHFAYMRILGLQWHAPCYYLPFIIVFHTTYVTLCTSIHLLFSFQKFWRYSLIIFLVFFFDVIIIFGLAHTASYSDAPVNLPTPYTEIWKIIFEHLHNHQLPKNVCTVAKG